MVGEEEGGEEFCLGVSVDSSRCWRWSLDVMRKTAARGGDPGVLSSKRQIKP